MVVKGEDKEGRLRYVWNDIEVLATPREKREPLGKTARKGALELKNLHRNVRSGR